MPCGQSRRFGYALGRRLPFQADIALVIYFDLEPAFLFSLPAAVVRGLVKLR